MVTPGAYCSGKQQQLQPNYCCCRSRTTTLPAGGPAGRGEGGGRYSGSEGCSGSDRVTGEGERYGRPWGSLFGEQEAAAVNRNMSSCCEALTAAAAEAAEARAGMSSLAGSAIGWCGPQQRLLSFVSSNIQQLTMKIELNPEAKVVLGNLVACDLNVD